MVCGLTFGLFVFSVSVWVCCFVDCVVLLVLGFALVVVFALVRFVLVFCVWSWFGFGLVSSQLLLLLVCLALAFNLLLVRWCLFGCMVFVLSWVLLFVFALLFC